MEFGAASEAGIGPSVRYRWWKAYEAEFLAYLESVPATNLIAQQLCEIEEMQRMALAAFGNAVTTDRQMKCLNAAMRAWERKCDLMLQTGILPKVPEKLYARVEDARPILDRDSGREDRSLDEVKDSIINLLARPRTVG